MNCYPNIQCSSHHCHHATTAIPSLSVYYYPRVGRVGTYVSLRPQGRLSLRPQVTSHPLFEPRLCNCAT